MSELEFLTSNNTTEFMKRLKRRVGHVVIATTKKREDYTSSEARVYLYADSVIYLAKPLEYKVVKDRYDLPWTIDSVKSEMEL